MEIELYNPETGEVVLRKYFTSSREFDKFLKDFNEGRWRGLEWRWAEKEEKPSKEEIEEHERYKKELQEATRKDMSRWDIDEEVKQKIKEILEKAKQIGLENLTDEQYKALEDLVEQKNRTDLYGIKYWKNLKLYVDDAYNQIVKGKRFYIAEEESIYEPVQTTLYGEKEKQRRFKAPPYKKPKPVVKQKKEKRIKPTFLEKYGAEIREKGKPKLDDYVNWKYFVNVVRIGDLPFLKRDLEVKDLERIWNDIKTHEKLALTYAEMEGSEEEARRVFEEIKEEFHRRIMDKDFYTDWEAEKVIERLNMPAELVGSIKEKGYSTKDVDVAVVCGKVPENLSGSELYQQLEKELYGCIERIRERTGCEPKEGTFISPSITTDEQGLPEMVEMICYVKGRKIPVDFFLTLEGENE